MSNKTTSGEASTIRITIPQELRVGNATDLDTVTLSSADVAKATREAPEPDEVRTTTIMVGDEKVEIDVPGIYHLDSNGAEVSGPYDFERQKHLELNAVKATVEHSQSSKQLKTQLNHDRNAFASVVASSRKEIKGKKAQSARYDELRQRYVTSRDNRLQSLPESVRSRHQKTEVDRLVEAENVFRSGDQEKIAGLFEVEHDEYTNYMAERFAENDVKQLEDNKFIQKYDVLADKADRNIVDRWTNMSRKQKLAASAGATALTMATVAVLPIGAAAAGTGAAGVGVWRTAKSAIRKSVMYKLNAGKREKSRKDLVSNVTGVDNELPSGSTDSRDFLDIVDATVEADRKDNRKTIRRVGYAAVGGAVFGGTIGTYGPQLFGTAKDFVGGLFDTSNDVVFNSVTDTVSDTADSISPVATSIPALDPELAAEAEIDVPTVVDRPVTVPAADTLETPDATDSLDADGAADTDTDTEADAPIEDEQVKAEQEATEVVEEQPVDDIAELDAEAEIEQPVNTPAEPDTAGDVAPPPEEIAPAVEQETLEVDKGDGFQKSLKDQYGLSDEESWNAYQAIKPHLSDQAGVYSEGGEFRLSAPGSLDLNPQASAALRQFLDTLEEDDELLPTAA